MSPDDLVDRFETEWHKQEQPPDLLDYYRQVHACCGDDLDAARTVMLDLVTTDLELRYRAGVQELRYGINDYSRLLPADFFGPDELRKLGSEEMVIRGHWGDCPRLSELVMEQFPGFTEDELGSIEAEYLARMEEEFPCSVVLIRQEARPSEFGLRTPCFVGRQRSRESSSPPMQYSAGAAPHRFVVVSRDEVHVSRQQVLLRRVAVDCLEVTALSDSVTTRLEGVRLLKGRTIEVPLQAIGIEIQFANVTLSLRRG